MLHSLSVQNFALIEHVSIQFQNGLHIITGETGSGKSILLGALNLILGERSDFSVIRDSEKKTIVEAVFHLADIHKPWFEKEDIDWDKETVVRREITAQGKSRAFINDTPVQLSQLKELTEQLVYIHSQHETLEIKKSSFQFDLVDAFSNQLELAQQVRDTFQHLAALKTEQKNLELAQATHAQELDFTLFQLNELEQLHLEQTNFASLEQDFSKLSQIDDLKVAYQSIGGLLDSDGSPIDSLRSLKTFIDKWKSADAALEDLSNRISTIILELQDISGDAEKQLNQLEGDPETLIRLAENLDAYNRILKKHHLTNQTELQELKQNLLNKVTELSFSNERLEELNFKINEVDSSLNRLAIQLYENRTKSIVQLENQLLQVIHDLKMEHAQLKVVISKLDKMDSNGGMSIEIRFSANKGLELKPIEKAASGGELSRVMLAIQRTMSSKKSLPTLILDEIDTGVSGEVALRMGKLLHQMGQYIQVLAITHLPQVAANGDVHFEVSKTHEQAQTITDIKRLNDEQRVNAIAKLIAGEQVTESARTSAVELLRK